jgi:hypothetical protein
MIVICFCYPVLMNTIIKITVDREKIDEKSLMAERYKLYCSLFVKKIKKVRTY